MSNSRRLTAVLIAGFSLVLVFGALLTALAETGFSLESVVKPTNTQIEVNEPDPTKAGTTEPTSTETPSSSGSETETTKTQKPEGTAEKSPTSTATKPPSTTDDGTCTKPDGWKDYKVKSGDTLFGIATLYQTDYPTLQEANCMGTSTQIITGQILWVPDNATLVPTKESTATPKPTKKPTSKPPVATSTPKTPTATITASPTLPTPTLPTCYTLTLGVDSGSTGTGGVPTASASTAGCATGKYAEGEIIQITAAPNPPYVVTGWSLLVTTTADPNKVNLTMPSADTTLDVTYGTLGP